MSNGGTKAAIGVAAAAAVFGGKELLHVAPQVVSHTAPLVEIVAGKGVLIEAAGGGAGGLRTSDKLAASGYSGITSSSPFDTSGSLGTTMRFGKIAGAEVNPNRRADIFATREGGRVDSAPQISPSRPLVVLNNGDLNSSGVASYFSMAEPKLSNDISVLGPPLSSAAVEIIVKRDLKNVAESAAKTSDSKVTFEALSGKLKIDSSITIGGIKIAGGEVNVYAVAGAITGGVMACNALVDASFKNCVDSAIKTTMNNFLKESKSKGSRVNAD